MLINGRYVKSSTVSGNDITFEFGQGADASLVSKHLVFDGVLKIDGVGGEISWTCKSEDIAQEYCPTSCACSG